MVILSMYCNNIFMFRNFYLDFTYERKVNSAFPDNDSLFPESKIKVRKSMVLMGGNAAGKTTFGKLLCAVNNFILGREVTSKYLNLSEVIYDKDKEASFIVEFAIDKTAYRVECIFNVDGLISEVWIKQKIYNSYNIKKLREKLMSSKDRVERNYINDPASRLDTNDDAVKPFYSKFLKDTNNETLLRFLMGNVKFHYLFSSFAEQSKETTIDIPIELLNKILPIIDNSIKSVVRLRPDDEEIKNNSYLIAFRNGETLTIPDGDLRKADRNRLSHGTYEALTFLNVLEEMKKERNSIIFVDEKLPHLHSELEAYLIKKAFLVQRDSQVFFTSHNIELLDLNIPYNAFMLFRRNGEFNEAFFVNDKFNKNDRRLKNYYENDYFGILPDYSDLDVYFEGNNHE